MKSKTVTALRQRIEKMEIGERVYINAINLSVNQIDYLRMAVNNGILLPDMDELKKMIKPEYIGEFWEGYRIAPQMTYTKDSNDFWYETK